MILTREEEKKIKTLQRKKGRDETGLCLVEGQKVIEAAGDYVEYTFDREDTVRFESLVTTKSPQDLAAVARIPVFNDEDLLSKDVMLVLDGVQDPGNVGGIFRLCQAFGASLLLVESADPASPKVIRSSAGGLFHVPWMSMKRPEVSKFLYQASRRIYRLEKSDDFVDADSIDSDARIAIVVGSEGSGIQMDLHAPSLSIGHNESLESLNVGHAVAIAMYSIYRHR